MIPLFFQVVLLESASKAGARLIIPSLGTPLGGVVAGFVMSRYGKLASIVRVGAFFIFVGNAIIIALRFNDAAWKYFVYLVPANFGTGMAYPGSLFTSLALFDHSGTFSCLFGRLQDADKYHRPGSFYVNCIFDPINGIRMGSSSHLSDHSKRIEHSATGSTSRHSR